MEKTILRTKPKQREGFHNEDKKLTRAARRQQLLQVHLAGEVIKMIHHFFPDFLKELRRVGDPRNQSYIIYPREILLLMQILSIMSGIGSMRQMTEEFNQDTCIENIKKLTGKDNLRELPYWETVNNFLRIVKIEDLERLNHALIVRLLRMRCFEASRINGKYWQILVDGTQLYHFSHRHCKHCLKRVYNKGKPDERTEYYHEVLEAKLYVCEDLVFSIATEFVENENEDVSKQDCERKAFYRLSMKLKNAFKRLPICLTMDSLYACEPVFSICQKYHWRFLVRFKEGSIPSVATEFLALGPLQPSNHCHMDTQTQHFEYSFVTGISYSNLSLNCLQLTLSALPTLQPVTTFVFLTNFHISTKNVADLAARGRARWKIENQGFNCQKNQAYFLSHSFSKDPNAMKAHYLLIQIAHLLVQLALLGLHALKKRFTSVIAFRRAFRTALIRVPLPPDLSGPLTDNFYLLRYASG